jgi:transcriptional regulator with PAS, ATPase and Fis domain
MSSLPELQSFLEGLPEPHILLDSTYQILSANAAYRRQFGNSTSVVGRHCYEVSHHFAAPCDQSGETCPLQRSRQSGQRERVLHLHHDTQGEAYVSIELTPVQDPYGQSPYYVERMVALPLAHAKANAQGLLGRSLAFQHMMALIARVAPSQAAVLLLGESGTGKELVAQAIHQGSTRSHQALVPVDCSSLSESLFESELFGHERGAFTGAINSRAGLVEAASGGTLFLDEVGDIPLPMQVKLLRLLETGTYRRVGSTELRHADLRIVSATHRDLDNMVARGLFREDLYYRLSTFPIRLPALRERGQDIALLARALLSRLEPSRELNLSVEAISLLQSQAYPGNVRELRNLLERAALLCDGDKLERQHIEQALQTGRALPARYPTAASPQSTETPSNAPPALKELEREALRTYLNGHTGTRAQLAYQLGISERSLYRKLKQNRLS